jgi:hypothetical protein
MMSTPIRNMP